MPAVDRAPPRNFVVVFVVVACGAALSYHSYQRVLSALTIHLPRDFLLSNLDPTLSPTGMGGRDRGAKLEEDVWGSNFSNHSRADAANQSKSNSAEIHARTGKDDSIQAGFTESRKSSLGETRNVQTGSAWDRSRACLDDMHKVEHTLFASLSWSEAVHVASELSHDGCDMKIFSQLKGPEMWDVHKKDENNLQPVKMRRCTRKNICSFGKMWLRNDTGADPDVEHVLASPEGPDVGDVVIAVNPNLPPAIKYKWNQTYYRVRHPFFEWLEALSERTGKRDWRIGLLGDSTVRQLAESFVALFLGDLETLSANYKKTYALSVTVLSNTSRLWVHYLMSWENTCAAQAASLFQMQPEMDIFGWNVGVHSTWEPGSSQEATKRAVELKKGWAKEMIKLDAAFPARTRAVLILTNSQCSLSAKFNNTHVGAAEEAEHANKVPSDVFAQSRNGTHSMNMMQKEACVKHIERTTRFLDAWGLTDQRCAMSKDGTHYPELDKYRVLSLLLDAAAWR